MQSKCNTATQKFVSAYGEKNKVSLSFTGEGRTKQSFKAECDINNILARYKKTGVLDFQQQYEPQYGDVPAVDFQAAQLMIAEAKSMFAAMPAALRSRFDNEPAKFLAFVQDERNRPEAEQLGLCKVKPEAPEAPQANPTATGGGRTSPKPEKGSQARKGPSPETSGEGQGEG